MKKLILLSLLGIIFTISSCTPEFEFEELQTNAEDPEEITMKNLIVSSDFNWKTYTDIELTLTGNSNNIIEVVSSSGLVYQKAYLSTDKAYKMKLSVPTHEKSVRLLYNDQDIPINISSGIAEYTFENN